MRRGMLECKDEQKINQFLQEALIGFLGLADGGEPYVVPLNFVWWNGCVYIHGAEEGRKIDIIQRNPLVCFTVSEHIGTMVHPVPAKTSTAYMSVMIFGTAEVVSDLREATDALEQMLRKYVPGYFDRPLSERHVSSYRSSAGSAAVVIKIVPDLITAKEKPLEKERKFYKGRTVRDDVGRIF